MSNPVYEFIDLSPDLVPALVLGARAGLSVHREDQEEAFAEIDGDLTYSQLMDLASWSKNYIAQPTEPSLAHHVFWEAGVTLQARFHAEAVGEVNWTWVEANVAGEYEYFTRMAIVRVGISFALLTTEVYRCAASNLHPGRKGGRWNESEELEVGNYFNAARHTAELLFELSDVEALILKANDSQGGADEVGLEIT